MVEDPYDKLKNLPPDLVARLKAERDARQAKVSGMKEEFARQFKPRDSVHFSYRTPDGHLDPNSDVFTLTRWSDDYGNTIYTEKGSKEDYPNPDQLRTIAQRVQAQQAAFAALDPSEQTRIRTDFTSSGNKPGDRFGDFLNNAALAEQFQKLK